MKNLPMAKLNLNPLTAQLKNCLQMRIKLSSAVINNIQREKLLQSIQDKNLLKSKVGCFCHFSYIFMINQFLHISLSHINPNKTGLFEDSFFWEGWG